MGHTYTTVLLHVVFATHERRGLIDPALAERLYPCLAGLARREFGLAVEIGGTSDHLHALVCLNPSVAVSHAMNRWKSLTSRWVHETLPEHRGFAWQAGYGAFSVSPSNREAVAQYIRGQPEHHRRQTFEEEFLALLERHGIAYDPRHVWG